MPDYLMKPRYRQGLLFCFFLFASSFPATATNKARLAFVGEHDELQVGQDGYCGARTNVARENWQSVFAQGGERVWFRLSAKLRGQVSRFRGENLDFSCEGEYSFVPTAGKLYIVRYAWLDNSCQFELFRSNPGGTPEAEPLTVETRRSCLGQ
jgi:hypothetical protein